LVKPDHLSQIIQAQSFRNRRPRDRKCHQLTCAPEEAIVATRGREKPRDLALIIDIRCLGGGAAWDANQTKGTCRLQDIGMIESAGVHEISGCLTRVIQAK